MCGDFRNALGTGLGGQTSVRSLSQPQRQLPTPMLFYPSVVTCCIHSRHVRTPLASDPSASPHPRTRGLQNWREFPPGSVVALRSPRPPAARTGVQRVRRTHISQLLAQRLAQARQVRTLPLGTQSSSVSCARRGPPAAPLLRRARRVAHRPPREKNNREADRQGSTVPLDALCTAGSQPRRRLWCARLSGIVSGGLSDQPPGRGPPCSAGPQCATKPTLVMV